MTNTRTCKYDSRKFCTPECDRQQCSFRFDESVFFNKSERPSMKSHKVMKHKLKRK